MASRRRVRGDNHRKSVGLSSGNSPEDDFLGGLSDSLGKALSSVSSFLPELRLDDIRPLGEKISLAEIHPGGIPTNEVYKDALMLGPTSFGKTTLVFDALRRAMEHGSRVVVIDSESTLQKPAWLFQELSETSGFDKDKFPEDPLEVIQEPGQIPSLLVQDILALGEKLRLRAAATLDEEKNLDEPTEDR